MLEKLRQMLRRSPDEFWIIRGGTNDERAIIERDLEQAPDPEQFKIERSDLRDGSYRCQAIRDGVFAEVAWTVEIGDPREAREIDELRRELEQLRNDLAGEREQGDVMDRLPSATLQAVLGGQLDVREARSIAELHTMFQGQGRPSGLSDQVEDPSDVGEIGGRALLEVLDDPSKLQELSEVAGSAVVGAAANAQSQPVPARPEQPAEQQAELDLGPERSDAPAAADGGQPEPEERKSAAREIAEDEVSEDAPPADAADAGQPEGGSDE